MNLNASRVSGNPIVLEWFDWVRRHFYNCMPNGLPTFTGSGDTRTTIDYEGRYTVCKIGCVLEDQYA
jgi:hypothetical protein